MKRDFYNKLTIIIPVFNGEKFLRHALNSLISTNAKIIVSDDGSTDSTRDICNEFKNNIEYRFHENIGQIKTLNMEWALADTEYLSYLNCDDLWPNGMYTEDAIEFLDNNGEFVMVTPNEYIIDKNSKIIKKVFLGQANSYEALVKKRCNVSPGVIFRRKHLSKWDPNYRLFADVLFYAELLSHGKSKLMKNYFSSFRSHDGSYAFSERGPHIWSGLSAAVRKRFRDGILDDIHRNEAVAWNIALIAREHLLTGNFKRFLKLAVLSFKVIQKKIKPVFGITIFYIKTVLRKTFLIIYNS